MSQGKEKKRKVSKSEIIYLCLLLTELSIGKGDEVGLKEISLMVDPDRLEGFIEAFGGRKIEIPRKEEVEKYRYEALCYLYYSLGYSTKEIKELIDYKNINTRDIRSAYLRVSKQLGDYRMLRIG